MESLELDLEFVKTSEYKKFKELCLKLEKGKESEYLRIFEMLADGEIGNETKNEWIDSNKRFVKFLFYEELVRDDNIGIIPFHIFTIICFVRYLLNKENLNFSEQEVKNEIEKMLKEVGSI